MAITYVTQNNATESLRMTSGEFTTTDTSTASLTIGYKPRFIRIVDESTQEDYTWIDVMGTGNILQRVDAGTAAMDTTQLVTASSTGFTFVPKASKTYTWVALG
jgi:hypothetical protein